MEVRLAVSPNIDLCTPVLLSTTNSVLAGKDREVIAVLTNTLPPLVPIFRISAAFSSSGWNTRETSAVAYCFHRVGYVKLGYPRAGKSVIVDCDKIAHGVALAVLLEGDGNKLGAVVKHVFAD